MPDIQDAISLIEAGDPGQAADLLQKLAAEMPGYATARVLLARSYERLNEWQPALHAWREAHQIIPNSPVVRRGLERAARRASSRSPIESPPEPTAAGLPEPEGSPPEDRPSYTEQPPAADQRSYTDEPPPIDHPSYEEEPPTAEQPSYGEEPDAADAPADELTTREQPSATEGTDAAPRERRGEEYSDLDRLISELESARIVPRPDLDNIPPPDLEDDIEDVVSETLARIYASQGQYDEAAHVYDLLADQQPDKADEFSEMASEMRAKASEQE